MLKFPEMLNNPNCLVTEAMSVLCVLVTGAAVWHNTEQAVIKACLEHSKYRILSAEVLIC